VAQRPQRTHVRIWRYTALSADYPCAERNRGTDAGCGWGEGKRK